MNQQFIWEHFVCHCSACVWWYLLVSLSLLCLRTSKICRKFLCNGWCMNISNSLLELCLGAFFCVMKHSFYVSWGLVIRQGHCSLIFLFPRPIDCGFSLQQKKWKLKITYSYFFSDIVNIVIFCGELINLSILSSFNWRTNA